MVDNNRRTKLLPKIIFGQIGVGLVICIIALASIFYAQGLRVDWKKMKVAKTGVLVAGYEPKDADLTINGKKICRKNPCVLNLPRNRYEIIANKEGFVTWQESVTLVAESVNIFQNIILFKSEITVSELSDLDKINLINTPVDLLATNAPDQLSYTDYEIWVGEKLLTRFSKPIQRAVWYPDLWHVVYQQGREIRAIEKNGHNDTLLVTLKQETAVPFSIGNRGQDIYFMDEGQYYQAKIR